MTKVPFAIVLLLSAAPALGQTELWPVEEADGSCSMGQTFSSADFGVHTLQVSYDAKRQLITLTSTSPVDAALPATGTVDMTIAFLDNGDEPFDDAWGQRRFTIAQDDGRHLLSTSFSGERNVRQVLADLAASRAVGFMNAGKVVTAFELRDADASLRQLRSCAAQVASN